MEIIHFSNFFQRKVNPHLDDFRYYIGNEVIIGLQGKDQVGNISIGYFTGLVGFQNLEDFSLGLYEEVNSQTGKGTANLVFPINIHTPISEAFFPARFSISENNSDLKKTSLAYLVQVDSNNLKLTNRFSFESKRTCF